MQKELREVQEEINKADNELCLIGNSTPNEDWPPEDSSAYGRWEAAQIRKGKLLTEEKKLKEICSK